MTCHYNPFGNGPLNDYGRALSATAISARWFKEEYVSEDEIANKSGFFYNQPENSWFRPSFDYRGLLIKKDFGRDNQSTAYIDMMADLNLVMKFFSDRLIFSGSIGYIPTPKALENSTDDEEVINYISREAYVGIRPFASIGLYAGLMDKVYGVRIPEHVAYSRSITNLSHNDQSVGVQIHYVKNMFEIGLNSFIGNTVQDESLRQQGNSAKIDYLISNKGSVGVSVLKSKSEFLDIYMNAFHFKTSVGKGTSVLGEFGEVKKTAVQKSEIDTTSYALAQANVNLDRGIFLINTVEYLKETSNDFRFRFGPGLQVFPAQRVEFRFDLYNTRTFSEDFATKDTIDFLTQLHLWF